LDAQLELEIEISTGCMKFTDISITNNTDTDINEPETDIQSESETDISSDSEQSENNKAIIVNNTNNLL
ncbi:4891_t:CDS:1, partial [Ambispora gerdemannii]